MELSNLQEAILDKWKNTDNNILIKSVAGSGKTSTLMLLLEQCKFRTLILAFNKSIQEEFQEEIDRRGLSQGKAMTMHSLGLSSLRQKYPNVKVVSGKNYDIIKKVQKICKNLYKKIPWKDRVKIGYSLMDMNDISRYFMTDSAKDIVEYMTTTGKFPPPANLIEELWNAVIEVRECYFQSRVLEIDFTDMIYIPAKQGIRVNINPSYVLVDEAQDFATYQHVFLDMLLEQKSVKKWAAAGDPRQSIYGFAGSNSNSFEMFLNKPDVIEMPLDLCYRCDVDIVKKANEVYNVMKPFKSNQGIVKTIYSPSDIKDGSLVICRNSAPLVKLFFLLLREGRNCKIKGEDILSSIIRFCTPYSSSTILDVKMESSLKIEELRREIKLSHDSRAAIELSYLMENYNNFKEVSSYLSKDGDLVSTLINKVKKLFNGDEGAITLCTIHKSKGLGRDIVYILNEDLIPSQFASTKEQLVQENNLKYVARTRAKKEMYFLNIPM